MVDIADSKWTEEDEGNTAPSPDGVQNGYSPKTNAPIMRAIRGGVKRFYNRINAIYVSTGTATAFVLTPDVALPRYTKGERIAFFAHIANTGPVTLNISGLGVRQVLRPDGTTLAANEIKAGGFVEVVYNGTNFSVVGFSLPTNVNVVGDLKAATFTGNGSAITGLDGSNIDRGTINDARLPTTMTGKTLSGALTISAGGATVTGNVTVTGDVSASTALKSAGSVFAGSSYLQTDGNIVGAAWGANGAKAYVDSKAASVDLGSRVAKTGDTMTGQLHMSEANLAFIRGGTTRYIHYDSANGSIGFLNSGGGWAFRVDNGGTIFANGNVYSGGAYLETNGNVQGQIWTNWGHWDAYTAINARIENRALAWANDRAANFSYRLVSEGNQTAWTQQEQQNGGLNNRGYNRWKRAPSGAVQVGEFVASDQNGNATATGVLFRYAQVYDPVRGWVGFYNA